MGDLIKTKEAAGIVGVSERHLLALAKIYRIKNRKLYGNRAFWWDREDVKRLAEQYDRHAGVWNKELCSPEKPCKACIKSIEAGVDIGTLGDEIDVAAIGRLIKSLGEVVK